MNSICGFTNFTEWSDANFSKYFKSSPLFVLFATIKAPAKSREIRISQVTRDLAQDEEEIRASSAPARARISFTSVVALIFVTVHQPAYRALLSAFLIVSARLCHDVHLVGAGSRGEATGLRTERGGWTFGLGAGHDVALLPSGDFQWSSIILGDLELHETTWLISSCSGMMIISASSLSHYCNVGWQIGRAWARRKLVSEADSWNRVNYSCAQIYVIMALLRFLERPRTISSTKKIKEVHGILLSLAGGY